MSATANGEIGQSHYARIVGVLGERVADRNIYVSPRLKTIYVSNPKCACSTIKLILHRAQINDPHYLPQDIHARPGNPVPQPSQVAPHRLEALLAGEAFRFTFVRSPYARIVSAYRDKFEYKIFGRLDAGRLLGKQMIRMMADFGLVTPEDVRAFTFADFVDGLANSDMSSLNLHWRPQVLNVAFGAMEYDMIGRVETFEEDIRKVGAATGIPIGTLTARNVRGGSGVVDTYLTPDLAAKVRKAYADDFEAFGYK
ncbi:MAG: sulfotransferase family protein [Parvibaculum sp.]|nr:sulfotransferase family protein [Parvibaculum sp.]